MPKFLGTSEEFKRIVESISLNGKWEDFDLGVRYRTRDGGVIQWYESKGTILIQGTTTSKQRLEALLNEVNFENIEELRAQIIMMMHNS